MRHSLRFFQWLALALSAAVGMGACKYECFGFPDVELPWVPYRSGDVLRYTNGTDTIRLDVVETFKTAPDYHRSSPVMDYVCFYEGYYLTTHTFQGYYLKEMLNNQWTDGRMKVWLTDHDLFQFDLFERNQVLDSVTVAFMPSLEIDGKIWYDVFKVEKNRRSPANRISWILKGKNKGVIRFYDEQTQETWTLID